MSKSILTMAVFGDEDLNNGDDLLSVEVETGMVDLFVWWMKTAAADFSATVPKIEEYGTGQNGADSQGSADLRAIGDAYAELLGWDESADVNLRQELACWTYLVGKIGRMIANYKQMNPGKEDTWFDATIYTMMARRLQTGAQWP